MGLGTRAFVFLTVVGGVAGVVDLKGADFTKGLEDALKGGLKGFDLEDLFSGKQEKGGKVEKVKGKCGDGIVAGDETCEPFDPSKPRTPIFTQGQPWGNDCRSDCTYCGDGVINSPEEECDEGLNNTNDTTIVGDACNTVCQNVTACPKVEEGPTACTDGSWILSDPLESCTDACIRVSKFCDACPGFETRTDDQVNAVLGEALCDARPDLCTFVTNGLSTSAVPGYLPSNGMCSVYIGGAPKSCDAAALSNGSGGTCATCVNSSCEVDCTGYQNLCCCKDDASGENLTCGSGSG
uniref:Uncharacterized protein n=1 Tax=Chromera velia CCMP2878 TaxID=1169474 RepID=A0A0G4HQ92_9ALVE|eukprot:Cvel_30112.t1-p1 / transcript=Cvel_30112.t1 / gene=Cvel_30112 / organism=Chromera_velia_CCMP2878 / gene_product=hypothetical protein / transcript_product=hypothetical protein / location=Cvel_scaffold4248:4344-5330(-) / protein_length=294 / sequence_SO=supercontig / SO=protein_coding / is_pseudo=false